MNIKEHLSKFNKKIDKGIFLGYSNDKKAYRVYNKRILTIEEAILVTPDETNDVIAQERWEDDDLGVQQRTWECENGRWPKSSKGR